LTWIKCGSNDIEFSVPLFTGINIKRMFCICEYQTCLGI